MDYQIFGLVNNLAAKNSILDGAGIFFAKFAIFLILAAAVVVIAKKGREAIISAILALFLVLLFDRILNLIVSVPRPFVENQVNLLVAAPANPSFPSTHAAISAAATTGVFYFSDLKYLKIATVVSAVLVGVSRIFVGVHYPTDVLVGFVLGTAAYITAVKLTNLLQLGKNAGEKEK